jgi:hypothetical protein
MNREQEQQIVDWIQRNAECKRLGAKQEMKDHCTSELRGQIIPG